METINYDKVQSVHGDKADSVAEALCKIHGGMALKDFKEHRGGMDISGCSEADKAKIADLMKKETKKKEGN